MIGSKFNYRTQQFDYYRIPEDVGNLATPPYGHRELVGNGTKTGFVPEQLAAPLPPNAQKIGSGRSPQGIVLGDFGDLVGATQSDAAIVALGSASILFAMALYGFAGYGIYTWWKNR